MGIQGSRDSGAGGIHEYQLMSMITYYVQVFNETKMGYRSHADAHASIYNRIKSSRRYCVNPSASPNSSNEYFPNKSIHLQINEVYRDIDNISMWEIKLVLADDTKLIQLVHKPLNLNVTIDESILSEHLSPRGKIEEDPSSNINNTVISSPPVNLIQKPKPTSVPPPRPQSKNNPPNPRSSAPVIVTPGNILNMTSNPRVF